MSRDPVVTMPQSKLDGLYRVARKPLRMVRHNAESWRIVETVLDSRGTAQYRDLAVAVRKHRHYGRDDTAPQQFIAYCIRRGWLQRVD